VVWWYSTTAIRSAAVSRVGVAVKEAVAVGTLVEVEVGDGRKGVGVEVGGTVGEAPQAEKKDARSARGISARKGTARRFGTFPVRGIRILCPSVFPATGSGGLTSRGHPAEDEKRRNMGRLYLMPILHPAEFESAVRLIWTWGKE
jgi:hypothetical protein